MASIPERADTAERTTAILRYFEASAQLMYDTGRRCCEAIDTVAERLTEAARTGHKLLVCGNGGSAADAQHCAAELVSTLSRSFQRPPIAALALTTDTSFLTAYANDYEYAGVFARQVEALGQRGDVLMLISTSGNSENLCRAARAGRTRGVTTIGLLGSGGGRLADEVDHSIIVPGDDTQHIQECHAAVLHVVCSLVERRVFTGPPGDPTASALL